MKKRNFLLHFVNTTASKAIAGFLSPLNFLQKYFKFNLWQRNSTIDRTIHISLFILTISLLVTGFADRIIRIEAYDTVLKREETFLSNIDLINQGTLPQLSTTVNPNIKFNLITHRVVEGESLQSIAEKYAINKDTIKWANLQKVNQYTDSVNVGDDLYIPELNGVVYEVKEGDTLEGVLEKTKGDRFQVIEINQLAYQNFQPLVNQKLLIPGGQLPPPPPLIPYQNLWRTPSNQGVNVFASADYAKLNGISFGNPLSNPDCGGYSISRGYFTGHNGADIAKAGGCPIRAVSSGTVAYAGWGNYGEGYHIRIDHGNGVSTVYFHGETIWATTGQEVSLGQEIMYMGCTGNCTGTHLHLGLRIDGIYIDPAPYIVY